MHRQSSVRYGLWLRSHRVTTNLRHGTPSLQPATGAPAPLVLSAVAVWERRLKGHSFHISGRRKGPVDPASVVAFAAAVDWELLPLTAHHAAALRAQPLGHKDPFDELLLVQALEEGMRLPTRDARLMHHPFAVAGGRD